MRKIRLFVPFVILSSSSQRVNEPSNEHRSFLILEKNRTVPGTAREKERERDHLFRIEFYRPTVIMNSNEIYRHANGFHVFREIFFQRANRCPPRSPLRVVGQHYERNIFRVWKPFPVYRCETPITRVTCFPSSPLFSIADGIRELLERRETRIYPICNNYPR